MVLFYHPQGCARFLHHHHLRERSARAALYPPDTQGGSTTPTDEVKVLIATYGFQMANDYGARVMASGHEDGDESPVWLAC